MRRLERLAERVERAGGRIHRGIGVAPSQSEGVVGSTAIAGAGVGDEWLEIRLAPGCELTEELCNAATAFVSLSVEEWL